jgi:hypothetical protein
MPSTNLISWDSSMVFDLNGRKNKTINRLNDGNLLSKTGDGSNENDFVLPFRSRIVLPNIYGNMKWDCWENFGNGGTFTVRLYNEAKTLLGTYSTVKDSSGWKTNNPAQVSSAPLNGLTMEQHTTVRFVEIYLPTSADININVYELRLYGDVTGVATPIFPGTEVTDIEDLGKYGFGINVIDDRVQEYLTGSPSTYLIPLMAASVRIGFEGPRFNIYPESYTGLLVDSPIDFGRFGNDHFNTRVFDFTRPRDIQVQMYHGGGSIKNLTAGQAAASNGVYTPNLGPVNDFKYLEIGADAEDENNWAAKAKITSALAVLFGDNASASLTGITITNGDSTVGQGGLHEVETGNEYTRDWATRVPYHNPNEYRAVQKVCYDDGKARNAGCKIVDPARTFLDSPQMKAVWMEHGWEYGFDEPYPADAVCCNLYLDSFLDGQSQSGDGTGVSPETWGLYDRIIAFKAEIADLMFPNIPLYLTETGYATSAGSGYDVSAIGSKTAGQVAGDLTLRVYAIAQCAGRIIQKIYYYAFFKDGTGNFDSMGATEYAPFTPGYNGNTVFPVGYCLANQLFVEEDYEWFSTRIQDGGTTGPWVTSKNHPTDPLKKLFKVWRGTMNGSTGSIAVPVGANAVSATLYTLDYTDFEPSTTTPSIVGTNVTITATEGMQWLEVTYENPANIPPVADAGTDQTIQLPTNQVTVDGSGSSDEDGTITTYAWTKISGPATFTITSPSSVSTTITGLVEGTYVFRLTVTDNDGGADTDDITITVQPVNVAPTAVAGSDQSITLPTNSVSVNGSSSSDPDGTIASYLWEKLSGPVAYTITNDDEPSTTITGLIAGVYVFRLTVTDDDGATGTDDVQITVNDEPGNISPEAAAGADQVITLPINFVTVNGSASSDPDGTITGYLWTKQSGPATYTITSPATAITTITGLVAGTYIFRLTVTDNDGADHSDDVIIQVNPVPHNNRRRSFFGTLRNIFRRR